MSFALQGVKVLDLSQMWAAPGAAVYLADQGADVIKVEPLWGDDSRRTFTQAPMPNGVSRSFVAINRGKRGLALDIGKQEGLEIVLRLVDRSDVLIHNFRPGVAERLGLGYDALRARIPRLVYAWVTSYGREGPYGPRRGYDRLLQALSGVMGRRSLPDGTPLSAGVWISDMAGPMLLAYGITLALLARERSGKGQLVEMSLLQVAIAMQAVELVRLESEKKAVAGGGTDLASQAMFGAYRCSDDLWLVIVVVNNKEWQALCQALDLASLAEDQSYDSPLKRAERSADLFELLAGVFETHSREHWLKKFEEADVPGAPVLQPSEVYSHPQMTANRMFTSVDQPEVGKVTMFNVPVHLSDTPGEVRSPAPLKVGEHTEDVLSELGYTANQVEALRRKRVIAP